MDSLQKDQQQQQVVNIKFSTAKEWIYQLLFLIAFYL